MARRSVLLWMALAALLGAASTLGMRELLAGSRSRSAVQQISSGVLYARVDEAMPFVPAPQGSTDELSSDGKLRVAYWSTPVYRGSLVEPLVRDLIAANRAESLELRLTPAEREKLNEALQPLHLAMRDLNLLLHAREEAIREQLRGNPERTIRIERCDRANDPDFPRLLATRRETTYKKGVLQSFADGQDELHYLVLWSEWPDLKQLFDDRFTMQAERRRQVREWLVQRFGAAGMQIFGGA